MTYEVTKVHKRLWIRDAETGELVYTPPDHIRSRMHDRDQMAYLAWQFDQAGGRDINAIIELETYYNPRLKKRSTRR